MRRLAWLIAITMLAGYTVGLFFQPLRERFPGSLLIRLLGGLFGSSGQ